MTYEPGTSDIFATDETPPPAEPLTDEQVLADLARRILDTSDGCVIETTFTGLDIAVVLDIPTTQLRLTTREYEVVIAAARGIWFQGIT